MMVIADPPNTRAAIAIGEPLADSDRRSRTRFIRLDCWHSQRGRVLLEVPLTEPVAYPRCLIHVSHRGKRPRIRLDDCKPVWIPSYPW